MSKIEQSVEVEVPLRTAYDQWTQFETFPAFMEGVESVQQVDDTHLHWVADIAGVRREWDAVILEQRPDQGVAWRATHGAQNDGMVTFQSLEPSRTKVNLRLDFDPDGFTEKAADALGLVKARAKGDLKRFKHFIESRGTETGGWRGTVN